MKSSSIRIALLLSLFMVMSCRAQQGGPVYDKNIKVKHFEQMKYPPLARTAHVQGVAVIWANLDAQGNVVDASAISGSEILLPDCLANIKKWQFEPNAQRAIVVVYNFRMSARLAGSGPSKFVLDAPNFVTITAGVPQAEP